MVGTNDKYAQEIHEIFFHDIKEWFIWLLAYWKVSSFIIVIFSIAKKR